MTVLSDVTIRAAMDRDELLVGHGGPALAKGCAYEFKAARVVFGGARNGRVDSVDLEDPNSPRATIEPSAVVWIRSRQKVRLPADIAGLWVQTNSLSRRGLLLLNSTLVEPGYEGYLSAHFVNLGARRVVIDSQSTIAKLLFLVLDRNAEELIVSERFANYDMMVDSLAADSNPSFLRIEEVGPDLRRTAEAAVADAKDDIDKYLTDARDRTESRLSELEKKRFTRIGGGFVLGLILAVTFLLWVFPYIRGVDIESRERMLEIAREENEPLARRLDQIQADLRALRDTAAENTEAEAPE